jgi:hypothetical protein
MTMYGILIRKCKITLNISRGESYHLELAFIFVIAKVTDISMACPTCGAMFGDLAVIELQMQ